MALAHRSSHRRLRMTTPSPAPSSASQASAANGEALPAWPAAICYYANPNGGGMMVEAPYTLYDVIRSERALAAAWEARAIAMSELLAHFESVLDRDEDRQKCTAMLACIGPLPSPREQRT